MNRVLTLYAASLAALGVLIVVGPYFLFSEHTQSALSRGALSSVGLCILIAQAILVFQGLVLRLRSDRAEADRLRSRLALLAGRDELTGAKTRSALLRDLERELEAVHRYDFETSAIMVDVDGMRGINLAHGYSTGDEVLKELVREIRRNIRKTDSIYRWHGGRFIILASHVGPTLAGHLAEKLRRIMANKIFPQSIKLTASLAVGQVNIPDSPESSVAKLKDALDSAKAAGRNRLEIIQEG